VSRSQISQQNKTISLYESGSSICRNSKLTAEIMDLQIPDMILGRGKGKSD
jgi:hypothetical protein